MTGIQILIGRGSGQQLQSVRERARFNERPHFDFNRRRTSETIRHERSKIVGGRPYRNSPRIRRSTPSRTSPTSCGCVGCGGGLFVVVVVGAGTWASMPEPCQVHPRGCADESVLAVFLHLHLGLQTGRVTGTGKRSCSMEFIIKFYKVWQI